MLPADEFGVASVNIHNRLDTGYELHPWRAKPHERIKERTPQRHKITRGHDGHEKIACSTIRPLHYTSQPLNPACYVQAPVGWPSRYGSGLLNRRPWVQSLVYEASSSVNNLSKVCSGGLPSIDDPNRLNTGWNYGHAKLTINPQPNGELNWQSVNTLPLWLQV